MVDNHLLYGMILQWTDGGVASKHVDEFLWYFNLEVQNELKILETTQGTGGIIF